MTAFRASYADWKLIKTRGCVQIVFELPVEQSDAAYQLLGGMPVAAREVWCGIARLTSPQPTTSPVEAAPRPSTAPPPTAGDEIKERRPFSALPYATQAGIRCSDPVFWAFLREMCAKDAGDVRSEEQAKQAVYKICQVSSRRAIKPDTEATEYWLTLNKWFDGWLLKERVA